jgi:hypothetical protein
VGDKKELRRERCEGKGTEERNVLGENGLRGEGGGGGEKKGMKDGLFF